ncbi:MAG: hypothetical protein R3B36_19870 [Polyangiaceae bacterium]
MRRAVASGLVLALTLVACGAERKAAQSPATASSPPAADDGAAEAATPADRAYAQPPPPPPAPGTAPSPAQPGGGMFGLRPQIAAAARDVDVASRELDVAAGDCQAACRALGSMDRSAGRICELARGTDETQRCDEAKRRVLGARDKVRATCGACPGGPSLERGAPVPSVP